MTMKKWMLIVPVLPVLLAIPGMTYAGHRIDASVRVVDGRHAEGSVAGARQSADSVQAIGCSLQTTATDALVGQCYATDSAGNSLTCVTNHAGHHRVIAAISSTSYISFSVSAFRKKGEAVECGNLFVDNGSSHGPTP